MEPRQDLRFCTTRDGITLACAVTGSGPKLVRNIPDQAMKHGRHQRPFMLGQPVAGAEEEIGPDGGQAVAPRATRGRV